MAKLSIMKASSIANKYHTNLYDNLPYGVHLSMVYKIACKLECNDNILIATYLHDILEDTDYTFEQLVDDFDENIAILVFAVTDEDGKNRKERWKKTKQKIIQNGEDAILLKICDRIANIMYSLFSETERSRKKLKMYKGENTSFKFIFPTRIKSKSLKNAIEEYNKLTEFAFHSKLLFYS